MLTHSRTRALVTSGRLLHLLKMAEATAPEMAQPAAQRPRIIQDLERNLFRIIYGFHSMYGVKESDTYWKKIATEIYVSLRQTQTYDKYGDTTNKQYDKGQNYEHVAGIDEALDGHMDITFNMVTVTDASLWKNLYKCSLCNKRRFYRKQNLYRHLDWHSNPVVSKAPNDEDELNFEPTDEWLCQFKKKFLWAMKIYMEVEDGMPAPNGSSVNSSGIE